MNSRFAKAMRRADQAISAKLNDSSGCYTDGKGHRVSGLELMADRSIERAGVLEMFPAGQVSVTVLKRQLAGTHVQRGGIFQIGKAQHIVEETIKDDGAFISFLCMESS